MVEKRYTPHEPEEELLGPEELEHDLEVLKRATEIRRWELIGRSIAESPKAKAIVNWLIRSGFCKDEKEAILRALETLFFAVAPENEREKVFAQREHARTT
ncbi:hypothetical protein GG496_001969 [Candidatus Fervidibacteria bacterium JGI MDM2 JNZ-1-D12]